MADGTVVDERGLADAPWTLLAYFVVRMVGSTLYWISQPDLDLVLTMGRLMLFLLLAAGLFARLKGVWIFAVFAEGVSVIASLNPNDFMFDVPQALFLYAGAGLLVARPTREWCRVG